MHADPFSLQKSNGRKWIDWLWMQITSPLVIGGPCGQSWGGIDVRGAEEGCVVSAMDRNGEKVKASGLYLGEI